MADKLKECPFCGGEASIYHGDSTDGYIKGTDYVMAFCGWCGASIRGKNEDEVIKKWNNRPSPWHTGTPTEDGFYLCKVHYGDIPDDMRILEWVRDMGCFCLPESRIRGYHFYVGNEGVEVVYEWQRLTMRFRKEHGGWLEPYKED